MNQFEKIKGGLFRCNELLVNLSIRCHDVVDCNGACRTVSKQFTIRSVASHGSRKNPFEINTGIVHDVNTDIVGFRKVLLMKSYQANGNTKTIGYFVSKQYQVLAGIVKV